MLIDGLQKVNALLSDRSRLAIMVLVSTSTSEEGSVIDFNTLLERLDLTKGNLSSHLRKLEEGGLIEVTKTFVERKPRTTYTCTKQGRKDLSDYLVEVEKLLKLAQGN